MLKALDKKHFNAVVAGLTAFVVAVCLLLIPAQNNALQHWLYDSAQRHASTLPAEHVAIVAIDDDSKARLGDWPWPNDLHARLVEQLRKAGARAIAFTVPLNDTHRDGATSGDQQLAQAMQHHGRVLLPLEISTHLEGDNPAPALEPVLQRNRVQTDPATLTRAPAAQLISNTNELLNSAYAVGHMLEPSDSDGVTRRELVAARLGEQVLPALSLALASTAVAAQSPQLSSSTLQLGPTLGSTAIQGDLSFLPRLQTHNGPLAIPEFPYWRVLNGTVLSSNFKDKLVLVGVTDGINADRVQTALGAMPRVELIASATESLLNGSAYSHPWWSVALQLMLAAGVVLFAVAPIPQLARNMHVLIALGIACALLLLDFTLLRSVSVSLQLVPVCIALVLTAALVEILRAFKATSSRSSHSPISTDTLKTLALTLHGQGQLDLAYETLRRCPVGKDTLDLLYRLGTDYERRQETRKAAQVYGYIAQHDASYKDAQQRSTQLLRVNMPLQSPAPSTPPTRTAVARSSGSAARAIAPAASTKPKEALGRYEIERQIGKGAMGVVYLGRDPKINRVVAIKAIPLAEEFEDSDLAEARERFFREAEMAGRLNHPGIVTIYDAGEDHGLAYIAMEFIQGEHLSYYCDPHRLLPIRKALSLVVRVADALHYAHLQNVVHRDIKPANIMFNIETDALKITDFGIARLSDVSRTKTGIVLGTPSFMSPEQLEGRPLDGRSDLFALGVTMYQLLTGVLPFRADSMTRLMNKIATEPHPPMRSIRPELPAHLEDIVNRGLAKSAEDRYQTGAEMAEAIRTAMRTIAP